MMFSKALKNLFSYPIKRLQLIPLHERIEPF